jgi:hypothetical protein
MEIYSNDIVTSKWALKADADITLVAHKNMIGMNAQFIHIKGHQDKRSTEKPLNLMKLNIKADELATQQRQLMKKPKTTVTTKTKHLRIRDMYVTRDSQQWTLDMSSNIPMQQYYQEKYGWSKTMFEEIDWDSQWRVLTNYDINDKRRILKFVHGWLPTNYRLHRERQQSTPRCPLCYYLEEKEAHLFQCQHPLQQEQVTAMIQAVLNIKNINQDLAHIIAESLKHSIHQGAKK